MQSKTLCFNRTLFHRNLTRFWPLWALYAAIWLLMGPMSLFVEIYGRYARGMDLMDLANNARSQLLGVGANGGLIMGAVCGVLFAMALFSYLTTARSVGMFHSFPIRRESLFFTGYLSGAAVFTAVLGVTTALCAVVAASAGIADGRVLGQFFLCAWGQMLFFYSFAVFCAMFTGQILAIPVFYGVLNFLVYAVCELVQSFASAFYYGYEGWTPEWVLWLTPAVQLSDSLTVSWREESATQIVALRGMTAVVVYIVAGLVLTALALLIYRRRPSESAGDTVAIRWARPVFLYGVTVSAALSLGQGLYYLVWEQLFGGGRINFPAMLVCVVTLGAVGYFAAAMLLRKSFRVLKSDWRGGVAAVVALVIFGLCVQMDVLGLENRLPNAEQVTSLSFSMNGNYTCSGAVEDPETIAAFVSAHKAILAEKETLRQDDNAYRQVDGKDYAWVWLEYQLGNGETLHRTYHLQYPVSELEKTGSAMNQLAELATKPVVQTANLLTKDISRFTGGEFGSNYNASYQSMDAQETQALYDAIARDVAAGHFGKNQFYSERWQEETYTNDLELYYISASAPEEGTNSFSLTLSVYCTETLAALKELGVVDAAHPLITYAQRDAMNAGKEDAVYEADSFPRDDIVYAQSAF